MSTDALEQQYPGLLERLGKEPDAKLAKELGLSRARIYQFRQERGIPSASRRSSGNPTFINELFRHLRDAWATESEKPLRELAALLGCKVGRLSEWANGTGNRRPTWPTIFALAALTGRSIIIGENGVTIRKGAVPARQADVTVVRGTGETW